MSSRVERLPVYAIELGGLLFNASFSDWVRPLEISGDGSLCHSLGQMCLPSTPLPASSATFLAVLAATSDRPFSPALAAAPKPGMGAKPIASSMVILWRGSRPTEEATRGIH